MIGRVYNSLMKFYLEVGENDDCYCYDDDDNDSIVG
jgi:hypothetical protein